MLRHNATETRLPTSGYVIHPPTSGYVIHHDCTQVNTGWSVGVVKSVKKKKSVAGQFTESILRSEVYRWTQKLNREDYTVDK